MDFRGNVWSKEKITAKPQQLVDCTFARKSPTLIVKVKEPDSQTTNHNVKRQDLPKPWDPMAVQ
jgi:hypothetical protein